MSADSDMVERVAAAMAAVDRGEGYKVLARAALDASGIGALEQRIDALETALEPLALLAGDVNMNDPLRKWFSVAQLHDAAELLSRAPIRSLLNTRSEASAPVIDEGVVVMPVHFFGGKGHVPEKWVTQRVVALEALHAEREKLREDCARKDELLADALKNIEEMLALLEEERRAEEEWRRRIEEHPHA